MYGLIISAGIFLSSWYAEKEAISQKIDKDLVWDALFWVLIGGIIGARAYHVIDYWGLVYSKNPFLIPQVWLGGLGIFGGILGGSAALLLFCRRNKIERGVLIKLLDIAGASIPLGQFVGRWGNYFNQELFGLPTSGLFRVLIPIEKRPPGFEAFSTFHPIFLYESLASLLLFILLFLISHKFKKRLDIVDGEIFLMYLSGYGLIRLILEPLRINHWMVGEVNITSAISAVSILFPAFLVFIRRR